MLTRDSIIRRTGQSWKVALSLGFTFASSVAMFYGIAHIEDPVMQPLVLVSLPVSILSFFGAAFLTRCPGCGMPWVWTAMRTQDHKHWLNWLIGLRRCPRCGLEGVGRPG